ncbi:interference hedgehog [Galendromus occidentalis]|uniref:Interference hedgehog n=1 Tax=Galendromus occidentalis TaxID=34638 RepID=A0AAJ6VZ90_9ACAR|nr:interference hedgehog [Galendromus occidentalis]
MVTVTVLLGFLAIGFASVVSAQESTNSSEADFHITSKPLTIEAKLGDRVTLPCEYKGRPDNTYRLWFHDQNVISVDEKIIHRKGDFELDGMNLVVIVSRPELADKYTCKFNDNLWSNVTHRILLLGPPTIDVDNKVIDVREGGSISFACTSSSAPAPKIEYTKVNGTDQDIIPYLKNNSIRINDAARKHAGTYRCTAQNGYKPDAVQDIVVKYEGRPDVNVAIQWHNLNSETEKSVELTCKAHSESPVKFQWRNAKVEDLKDNRHFTITTKADSSTLKISQITKDLFDTYFCVASNTYGKGTEDVEISSLPIRPIVTLEPTDVSSKITLTTVSPYRVRKFVLVLRNNVRGTKTIEFPLSENEIGDKDGNYTVTQTLTGLIPDVDYEGTVIAVTDKEESSAQGIFSFHTRAQTNASSASQLVGSLVLVIMAVALTKA